MARGKKNELVKCPYCGELYSVTYKHCPFCNEDGTGRWDDPDTDIDELDDATRRGGKRLAGSKGPSVRGIIWGVLSLALIVAAAGIVISILHSALGGRRSNPSASISQPPATVSAAPTGSQPVAESAPPAESKAPEESQTPLPQVTTPSAPLVKPTGFTLNREDFTFNAPGQVFDMEVRFTPADATAEVTWKSSDPNIAAISWNGRVIAVSRGTVTLTATVEGVGEKTCICRCSFSGTTPAPTTAPVSTSAPAGSGLKLNREDFTLSREGETFRMVVSGTDSTVTWASSNISVASIGADGTVKAVGKGTCNVTATVDGVTLKCIVRCSW